MVTVVVVSWRGDSTGSGAKCICDIAVVGVIMVVMVGVKFRSKDHSMQ